MESNIRVINKIAGVRFVNHEYDYGPKMDDSKSWYQLIITITISEKTNAFFFGERAFNTNYPKLGKISLAETLSDDTLLGNPQFGRISGCFYGYCDKFCDRWI